MKDIIRVEAIDIEIVEREKNRLHKQWLFYCGKGSYIKLIDEVIDNGEIGEDYGTDLVDQKEILGSSENAEQFEHRYFDQMIGIENLIKLAKKLAREQLESEV